MRKYVVLWISLCFGLNSFAGNANPNCSEFNNYLRSSERIIVVLSKTKKPDEVLGEMISVDFSTDIITKTRSVSIVKNVGWERIGEYKMNADFQMADYARKRNGLAIGNNNVTDCRKSAFCLGYILEDLEVLKKIASNSVVDPVKKNVLGCTIEFQIGLAKEILSNLSSSLPQ